MSWFPLDPPDRREWCTASIRYFAKRLTHLRTNTRVSRLLQMSLAQTIADLRHELATNPVGDLPLWARLRLWRAMQAEFPRDGDLRRSYFALFVCDQLLPLWDKANLPLPYRELPHLLQQAARLYLNGVTSRESVVSILEDCYDVDQYLHSACGSKTYGDAGLVHEAAIFVAERVLGNDEERYRKMNLYERLESFDVAARPTEEMTDPGVLWDSHWIGSMLAVSGAIWEGKRRDIEAHRAYWRAWLEDWLPQFLGDIQVAEAAAKCLRDPYLNDAHKYRPVNKR
jgi:hypothetical protein